MLRHATVPLKVLIVEPDDDVRDVFALVLETLGYGASTVRCCHEVAERLARFEPEVIFIAVGFEDADSIALCRQLRKLDGSKGTKIVALLGYASPDTIEQLYSAGVDLTMQKPIEFERLLEVLKSVELARGSGSTHFSESYCSTISATISPSSSISVSTKPSDA